MNFFGITPISTIDFPKRVSSVLFCCGCNFDCIYCHNRKTLNKVKFDTERIEDIFRTIFGEVNLTSSLLLIDGIVISGGEPTVNEDLPDLIRYLKSKLPNLKYKLDTNGSSPQMLSSIIKEFDFVSMDIKHELTNESYKEITQNFDDVSLIKDSINIIKNSGIEHEFRTTIHSKFHDLNSIKAICDFIHEPLKLQLCNETDDFKERNYYFDRNIFFEEFNELCNNNLVKYKHLFR